MTDTRIPAPVNGHLHTLLTVVLAAFGFLMLTCLVSLMHSFMGGNTQANDFSELHQLQSMGIALAIVVGATCLVYFCRGAGLRAGLHRLWLNMPGWLIFGVLVIGLLVFAGELSFFIIFMDGTAIKEWNNHIALACFATSALAYGLAFATQHALAGKPAYDKSRW